MNELPTDQLLEAVIETARAAGSFALANKHRRHEVAVMCSHDVKLQLDIETQQIAEEAILAQYPDHTILGEEGQVEARADVYEWVIDPIDGTVNYTNDLLGWCTSVAVRLNGKTIAGCVYAPELDECYFASIDSPARCNGKPISPSSTATLAKALIHTGIARNFDDQSDNRAITFFQELSVQSQKVRICGAAAIDICNVARGRGDGFIETDLYLWDVAAAGLIAERAGATVETLRTNPNHGVRYLCSNGILHAPLKSIYTRIYGDSA